MTTRGTVTRPGVSPHHRSPRSLCHGGSRGRGDRRECRYPTLATLLRERYLAPRLGAVMRMVEAGIASGAVRDDLTPDIVRDLLIGPLVYRWLVSGEPMSTEEAAQLSRVLTEALRAPGTGARADDT